MCVCVCVCARARAREQAYVRVITRTLVTYVCVTYISINVYNEPESRAYCLDLKQAEQPIMSHSNVKNENRPLT